MAFSQRLRAARKLFARQPLRRYAVPEGVRVYAIGDVHGRFDLLQDLWQRLAADAAARPGFRNVLIHLGDYIDRGPQSRSVIEALMAGGPPDFETVNLMGNHEAGLLAFIDDPATGRGWLSFGGDALVADYGASLKNGERGDRWLERLRDALVLAMPASHLDFIRNLPVQHRLGDYLFAHAGIRPGRSLERQRVDDLLWIREPFLEDDRDFGCVVVHGHTQMAEPADTPYRISIDTGAYRTGRLTAVALEGDGRRFIMTEAAG